MQKPEYVQAGVASADIEPARAPSRTTGDSFSSADGYRCQHGVPDSEAMARPLRLNARKQRVRPLARMIRLTGLADTKAAEAQTSIKTRTAPVIECRSRGVAQPGSAPDWGLTQR